MLPRLRRRIAIGFATIIFTLLILEGLLLILVGYGRDIERVDGNIISSATFLISDIQVGDQFRSVTLTPIAQARTRLFDPLGVILFSGTIFFGQDPKLDHDPWILKYNNNFYRVLTIPIYAGSKLQGYFQMGERVYPLSERLYDAVPIIVLASIAIALFVFLLGIWLQKRSMRPAYQMFDRLEQFAQDAGHELKTPIACARSSLELAQSDGQYERHVAEAIEDIDRMNALTDALLQITTITEKSLKKEPVNISGLVESVVRELRGECEKKDIKFFQRIEGNVIHIADASLARIVLRNLLHNAIKFTLPGGEIHISLAPDHFSVRDSGIGMPPDVLAHVFNRFFKADTSRTDNGFGLGLTILKRIVDLHKWSVSVQSSPGVGSTFTVWFNRRFGNTH